MEKRISTGLSRREGRSFGLVVGGAFLVIAAITTWRGHVFISRPTMVLGGLLVLAGLLIPTRLGPVQRAWMGLAHAISKVTTPIIMSILYFVVITPSGILMRTLGRNPLRRVVRGNGYWVERRPEERSDMKRQF